jgi:hypothetical protein
MRTRRTKAAVAIAIAVALSATGMSGAMAATVVSPGSAIPGAAAPTGRDIATQPTRQSDPCHSNRPFLKRIFVTISTQHLIACDGLELIVSTAITTGASSIRDAHYATPTGTWRIDNKVRNTVLAGHDVNGSWRDPVDYWMPFWECYGFHDASWQKFPFGSSLYKTEGSHGCVHVPTAAMGVLYGWAGVGTLVTISN